MDDAAIAAALELDLALDLVTGEQASLDAWLAAYPDHQQLVRAAWQRRLAARAVRPACELTDFERDYHADRSLGAVRPLSDYLAAHPEQAAALAERLAVLDADRVAAAPAPDLQLAPGTTISRYRIAARLGHGGQGTVYRATDTELGRDVALKVVPAAGERSSAAARRFAAEARAGSRVTHPGLCTVHDAGTSDGIAFLVMELVEGESLAQLLAREHVRGADEPPATLGAPLDLRTDAAHGFRDLLGCVARLARALHAAHEAGLVHRDLKPANVMVTPSGAPVVLDFGLAREADADGLTDTGDLLGTPAYMAPEQIELPSHALDRRVDVYALGVLLYECTTLRQPFVAATRAGTLDAILRETALDPRRLQRGLSSQLALVIAKAMERDRERRYATAFELATDLEAVRDGAPIRARAPGPWRRFDRWRRSHPALTTAAAVLVLAAAALTWIQHEALDRVRAARDEAQAINDFLIERVLLSVTPEEARGREVRATDTLDRAAATVEQDLPAATPIAAAVRHVLGRANLRLERHDEALRWYQQALAMRREALGPDHPDTFATIAGEAAVLLELSRLDDADRLLAAALVDARRALGPAHPSTLALLHQHGRVAKAMGGRDDAVTRLDEAFAARRATLGAEAKDTLDSAKELALALAARGELARAEPLLRDVLRRRASAFGEDDVDVLHARSDLASLLHDRGQWDEADELYRQALAQSERVYGRDSGRYAIAANNYASLLHDRGRQQKDAALLDRAEAMFRESLAARERAYGVDSERVAKACNNLALLLGERGKHADAESLLQRTIAIRERLLGHDHLDTMRTRFALACNHWRQHGSGALDEIVAVVSDAREALGRGDTEFLGMQALSGWFLCQAGRTDEGIARLEDSYTELVAKHGPQHANARWAATQLATVCRDRGDAANAESWDNRARGH